MTEFVSTDSAVVAPDTTVTVSGVVIASGNLLVVTAVTSPDELITGVTFDGSNNLTKLGETINEDDGAVSIWYIESQSGTGDVVATLNQSGNAAIGTTVWSAAGTPDTYTEENPGGRDGASSPSSITVATAGDDDFIVDVAVIGDNAATVGDDQTEIFNENPVGNREYLSSYQDGAVSGDVMTWTWIPGTADTAHAACRIPNADAGTTVTALLGEVNVEGFLGAVTTTREVTALLGEVNVEGFVATLGLTKEVTSLLGEVNAEGFAPTVTIIFPPQTVTSLLGEVNVESFAAAITTSRRLDALLGEVNVEGFAATVSTEGGVGITVTSLLGTVNVEGFAPVGVDIELISLLGEVNVEGFAATITTVGGEIVSLLGEVNVEGFAATVTTTRTLLALLGEVNVEGFAADVGDIVFPPIGVTGLLGEINVVGFIPMVSLGKWTAIQKDRMAWDNVEPVSSAWATVSAQSTSWTSIDAEC